MKSGFDLDPNVLDSSSTKGCENTQIKPIKPISSSQTESQTTIEQKTSPEIQAAFKNLFGDSYGINVSHDLLKEKGSTKPKKKKLVQWIPYEEFTKPAPKHKDHAVNSEIKTQTGESSEQTTLVETKEDINDTIPIFVIDRDLLKSTIYSNVINFIVFLINNYNQFNKNDQIILRQLDKYDIDEKAGKKGLSYLWYLKTELENKLINKGKFCIDQCLGIVDEPLIKEADEKKMILLPANTTINDRWYGSFNKIFATHRGSHPVFTTQKPVNTKIAENALKNANDARAGIKINPPLTEEVKMANVEKQVETSTSVYVPITIDPEMLKATTCSQSLSFLVFLINNCNQLTKEDPFIPRAMDNFDILEGKQGRSYLVYLIEEFGKKLKDKNMTLSMCLGKEELSKDMQLKRSEFEKFFTIDPQAQEMFTFKNQQAKERAHLAFDQAQLAREEEAKRIAEELAKQEEERIKAQEEERIKADEVRSAAEKARLAAEKQAEEARLAAEEKARIQNEERVKLKIEGFIREIEQEKLAAKQAVQDAYSSTEVAKQAVVEAKQAVQSAKLKAEEAAKLEAKLEAERVAAEELRNKLVLEQKNKEEAEKKIQEQISAVKASLEELKIIILNESKSADVSNLVVDDQKIYEVVSRDETFSTSFAESIKTIKSCCTEANVDARQFNYNLAKGLLQQLGVVVPEVIDSLVARLSNPEESQRKQDIDALSDWYSLSEGNHNSIEEELSYYPTKESKSVFFLTLREKLELCKTKEEAEYQLALLKMERVSKTLTDGLELVPLALVTTAKEMYKEFNNETNNGKDIKVKDVPAITKFFNYAAKCATNPTLEDLERYPVVLEDLKKTSFYKSKTRRFFELAGGLFIFAVGVTLTTLAMTNPFSWALTPLTWGLMMLGSAIITGAGLGFTLNRGIKLSENSFFKCAEQLKVPVNAKKQELEQQPPSPVSNLDSP